jgi:hypothetical protein
LRLTACLSWLRPQASTPSFFGQNLVPNMDVTMLLCDAAQQVGGKLYILGGGWSLIFAPSPITCALAIKLAVPWDQANRKITFRLALVDDDGNGVDMGEGPVHAEGNFEVGRPPGLKPGTSIDAPFVLNFGGLVLEPGGYVFDLEVDGQSLARTPFRVLESPPMPGG